MSRRKVTVTPPAPTRSPGRKPPTRKRLVNAGGVWMKGTVVAKSGAVLGAISLGLHVGMVGFVYGTVLASIDRNKEEVSRNFREDERDLERVDRNLQKLEASILPLFKVPADIEVIKSRIDNMVSSLLRLEGQSLKRLEDFQEKQEKLQDRQEESQAQRPLPLFRWRGPTSL